MAISFTNGPEYQLWNDYEGLFNVRIRNGIEYRDYIDPLLSDLFERLEIIDRGYDAWRGVDYDNDYSYVRLMSSPNSVRENTDLEDKGYVYSLFIEQNGLDAVSIDYLRAYLDKGDGSFYEREFRADYLGGSTYTPFRRIEQSGSHKNEVIDFSYIDGKNMFANGYQGDDRIYGGESNDWLHGGNGADFIVGGDGDDNLHGDFGANCLDGRGYGKTVFHIKSDQLLFNWLLEKDGNNPDGAKADLIVNYWHEDDSIILYGAKTEDLAFRWVEGVETNYSTREELFLFDYSEGDYEGVGIFAEGYLEAIVLVDEEDLNYSPAWGPSEDQLKEQYIEKLIPTVSGMEQVPF